MRAHFPAIHAVDLAHALFDEGMAGLGLDRLAPQGFDDLDGIPGEPRIVHHLAAAFALEQHRGEETHDVIPLDELAALIEEETPVEVAVPGEPQVRPVCADRRRRRCAILLDHRVGDAVRETAVGLVVQLDEFEGQPRFEAVHDEAGAAVSGIHHDLQGLELAELDIGQEMLDVGGRGVDALPPAAGARVLEPAALGDRADFLQAVVARDRFRLFPHELHAVVVRGVVAGGDHDAAVVAAVEGRKIHALGAADADVENVRAALRQAAAERIGERLARQSNVAPDHHALGRQKFRIGTADPVGHIVIEFRGDPAAKIVGLEARDRAQVLVPCRP